MTDRRAGEVFEYDMLKLQVVESDYCRDCFFFIPEEEECTAKRKITGKCGPLERADEKSVIFVQVGEVE